MYLRSAALFLQHDPHSLIEVLRQAFLQTLLLFFLFVAKLVPLYLLWDVGVYVWVLDVGVYVCGEGVVVLVVAGVLLCVFELRMGW